MPLSVAVRIKEEEKKKEEVKRREIKPRRRRIMEQLFSFQIVNGLPYPRSFFFFAGGLHWVTEINSGASCIADLTRGDKAGCSSPVKADNATAFDLGGGLIGYN